MKIKVGDYVRHAMHGDEVFQVIADKENSLSEANSPIHVTTSVDENYDVIVRATGKLIHAKYSEVEKVKD